MKNAKRYLFLALLPGLLAISGTSHDSKNDAPHESSHGLAKVKIVRPQARVPRKIGATRKVEIGAMVPDFEMASMSGTPLSGKDYRGKVIVAVYVSANQRNSEVVIENAQQVCLALEREDLSLVFMTADFVHKAWFARLWKEWDMEAPLGFDSGRRFHEAAGILALPSTLLIDREGKLVRALPLSGARDPVVLRAFLRQSLGMLDTVGLAARLAEHKYDGGSQRRAVARHRAAARMARDKGAYEIAEKELRQALEIDAIHIPIMLDLANVLLLAKSSAKAQATIATVLSMDARNRRARTLEGIALFEIQDYPKAQLALLNALVLNPNPARAHLYLGLTYEKLGNKDEAMLHMRKASEFLESKRAHGTRER